MRFYFHSGQNVTGRVTEYKSLGEKPYFRQIRTHCSDIQEKCKVTICKSVTFKGTEYKNNYFLMQENSKVYQIQEILYFHDFDLILFVCTQRTIKFDSNLNSFCVNVTGQSPPTLLNITSFNKYFPMQLHSLKNKSYCRPKYI